MVATIRVYFSQTAQLIWALIQPNIAYMVATIGSILEQTSPSNLPNCVRLIYNSFISCITLAMELLDFQGSVEKEGDLISWTTATENQVDYFMVKGQ